MPTAAMPSLRPLHGSILLLLVIVLGGALAQGASDRVRPSVDPLSAPWHEQLVAAANAARTAGGLPAQRPQADLAAAAQIHAEEMAELGYFSHTSPTPGRTTPTARVALVGGPQIAVAENIALIDGSGDLVERTIDGWLDSPDHRANLLRPGHHAVGFGLAENRRGETYVVQVTAVEPRELASADVGVEVRTEHRVVVEVTAERAVDAAVAWGDRPARRVSFSSGRNEMSLATTTEGRQQLRIGIPSSNGDAYMVDAAGWIEPATGAFEPDPDAPGRYLAIAVARVERMSEPVALVRLRYSDGSQPLALFVDGEHAPEAEASPGVFEAVLPTDRPSNLTVGMVDGDSATFFHRFRLAPVSGGSVELIPGEPDPRGS